MVAPVPEAKMPLTSWNSSWPGIDERHGLAARLVAADQPSSGAGGSAPSPRPGRPCCALVAAAELVAAAARAQGVVEQAVAGRARLLGVDVQVDCVRDDRRLQAHAVAHLQVDRPRLAG